MKIFLAFVVCYLLGAIPFGLIMGKLRGVDIRQHGSGNIGATNVLRTLGKGPAILVFILDAGKGFAGVMICRFFGLGDILVVVGALLAIMGHSFSIFMGFKGGKAVSTSLGVIFGLNWIIALIAFGIWATMVGVTRYVSVASIVATISVPTMMICWKAMGVPVPYQILAILAAIAIVIKHISNIKRLISGTEPKIGQKVALDISKGEK